MLVLMASIQKRTKSVDLDDETASVILHNNVSIGHLLPDKLWLQRKVSKSGTTSDWAKLKVYYSTLSDTLDATEGHCLNQHSTARQLRKFLKAMIASVVE